MTHKTVLDELSPLRQEVELRLKQALASLSDHDPQVRPPKRLKEAMGHSLLAGGKRLRPLLVLKSAEAVGGDLSPAQARALAWPAALAIEMVHTYSLIHDDLPAMDDDTLRRGKPTCHVAFDEGTAILAGDALLTDAFSLVARAERNPALQALELSLCAGSSGMVAGQADDMAAEGQNPEEVDLPGIHRRKTGRLFVGACALGALAVDAPGEKIDVIRQYGAALGLAFQIADDVLDVTGDIEAGGKKRGRDLEANKATYVRIHGLEKAQAMAKEEAERAASLAESLGPKARLLADLARFSGDRTH
jgi:geranylgeranyl pyrophosphate synthase